VYKDIFGRKKGRGQMVVVYKRFMEHPDQRNELFRKKRESKGGNKDRLGN
jgi:hypothetical protein